MESLLPLSAQVLGLGTPLGSSYPGDVSQDSGLLPKWGMLTPNLNIDLLPTAGLVNGVEGLNKDLNKIQLDESGGSSQTARFANYTPKRSNTLDSAKSDISTRLTVSTVDASHPSDSSKFQPRPGYTAW